MLCLKHKIPDRPERRHGLAHQRETKAEALSQLDIRASVVTPLDVTKTTLLHATAYSGIPHRLSAFKAAHEVLVAEGVLK